MQSESRDQLLNANLKVALVLLITFVLVSLVLFRNLFFQSTYLLKSFGELSVDPEIAFKNNKPTFLEFYAEWCEVCKEMAPKVSTLKKEFENDINFVFLNVDNQKWDNYIRKFEVNGIPQVNLFDGKGKMGAEETLSLWDTLISMEPKFRIVFFEWLSAKDCCSDAGEDAIYDQRLCGYFSGNWDIDVYPAFKCFMLLFLSITPTVFS